MNQNWEDLLLLHWPVQKNSVQETLPDDLDVDLFQGQAWLSVVGFKLSGLRISPVRWIPWPAFWEINLRTYVTDRYGNKGIWFYSLDSSDFFAVPGARILYGLPYNLSQSEGRVNSGKVSFSSQRKFPHQRAGCRFGGSFDAPKPDSSSNIKKIDRFLLERYQFWSRRKWANRTGSAKVMHKPYDSVYTSENYYEGELFKSQGFEEPNQPPTIGHYCRGFSVQATAPPWMFSIAGHANQR